MNLTGRRVVKATAAVLGVGALSALGSATAFAATPTIASSSPNSHNAKVDSAHSIPVSPESGDLHTFVTPTMAMHVAEPSTRHDYNNNGNDNSYDSGYRDNGSRYSNDYGSDRGYDNGNYDNGNYDNGYGDSGYYDHGYYGNGYRHNDNGLLGGGLLGGNN